MKKIKIKVTDQEHRLIIHALNELRNEQIRQNKISSYSLWKEHKTVK